ncbi:CcdC protein domain-containing protein [Paenibacillus humicola]|uniref:CcdC protein domain-containing protein n=1 Tax=Paenibacillus humicola TaxID=3110540 RepID=UPI00237B5120|nr:CcdC protein domain-containing protein [Paenibacillus humicola]
MTLQNFNTISTFITWGVVLTAAIQLWETTRPLKGKGLFLLLGDVHALGVIPWAVYVFSQRASWTEVALPAGLGILLSLPLIVTTNFVAAGNGRMKFQRNPLLYLFLIGIPFLRRYLGINWLFERHPVFLPHSHIPDINLMIVMYLTMIVVNIYTWRLVSYGRFRQLQRKAAHMSSV